MEKNFELDEKIILTNILDTKLRTEKKFIE